MSDALAYENRQLKSEVNRLRRQLARAQMEGDALEDLALQIARIAMGRPPRAAAEKKD